MPLTTFRLREIWILIDQVIKRFLIKNHLTENLINAIARNISLNVDIISRIKMTEDQNFNKNFL